MGKKPRRKKVVLRHPPETPTEKRARQDAARAEAERREAEYHRKRLNPHHDEDEENSE